MLAVGFSSGVPAWWHACQSDHQSPGASVGCVGGRVAYCTQGSHLAVVLLLTAVTVGSVLGLSGALGGVSGGLPEGSLPLPLDG